MVTPALWQADAAAAAVGAAAWCMMRPPSLNTLAIVLLSTQVAAPATSCHLALWDLHRKHIRKENDRGAFCLHVH